MRRLLLAAALAALPLASGHAVVVLTYGQTGSANDVTATPNAGDTATTISATDVAINVTQCVGGVICLGAEFLDITATSVDNAVTVGTAVVQHYDGSFSIFSGAGMTGVDILSGTFTDAALGAGPQLNVTVGAPPDTLTLTSAVIPQSELQNPSGLGFSFTNVIPPVTTIGSGCPTGTAPCTLAGMSASVAGNVSATSIPEPASLAILGTALIGFAGLVRLRRQ